MPKCAHGHIEVISRCPDCGKEISHEDYQRFAKHADGKVEHLDRA